MTYRARLAMFLVVLSAGWAHAEPPAAENLATADALFVEGRRLSTEHRFAEACARFEASLALSARLGVALNLADCYEHLGRTASAWVAFGEAAALARRLADPREAFALQRREALARRLSRLRIALSGAPVDGLAVTRDGARVEPAAYGVDVPVDPGPHAVDASAPGHSPWSTRIVVSGEGEVASVNIPELEHAPVPQAGGTAAPAAATAASARRRITPAMWVALGVTAAGITTGTGFALSARSLWQQAAGDCDPSHRCGDAAYAIAERSRRDGDLATAAFAVGGAALVTGMVLYLRSGGSERSVRVVPVSVPRGAGAAVAGRF